jgi:hypothetical protein
MSKVGVFLSRMVMISSKATDDHVCRSFRSIFTQAGHLLGRLFHRTHAEGDRPDLDQTPCSDPRKTHPVLFKAVLRRKYPVPGALFIILVYDLFRSVLISCLRAFAGRRPSQSLDTRLQLHPPRTAPAKQASTLLPSMRHMSLVIVTS